MRTVLLMVILFFTANGFAQRLVTIRVVDSISRQGLRGATVAINNKKNSFITDSLGTVSLQITHETFVTVSHIGYIQKWQQYLPVLEDTFVIALMPADEQLDEVTISSTRSRRNIADIPMRVEVLAGEELAEKAVMQPGNVKMLLSESTGIQTQQTSATSGSASIRIQGLEGRYTQLLKDGFPIYSGFSSGLSILQVPPLDLKRVELIKGSASTLYGGGAIAGLVNFISKEPVAEPVHSAMFNINQTGAVDASVFNSSRRSKWGHTFYTSYNTQKLYDNNEDGLSDMPHFTRLSVNPKLFYYGKKTKAQWAINANFEKREGGDILVLKGRPDAMHQFFEKNNSDRIAGLLSVVREIGVNSLTFKNSVSFFNRQLSQQQYLFQGKQWSTFSELNMYMPRKISEWVTGVNMYSDAFEQSHTINPLKENRWMTGAFVQNNLKINNKISVEAGLRTDYAKDYHWFVLPRLSFMFKFNPKITTRLGGGLGYKLPTVFTEQSEEIAFKNVQTISTDIEAENSTGINWDINYRTTMSNAVQFSINQLFFFTRLQHPVLLKEGNDNLPAFFYNASGNLNSKGFETNLRLQANPVTINIGYTFINAAYDTSGIHSRALLTARHRIYITAMYEIEEKFRLAYELFYTGPQWVIATEKKKGYWVTGISAERRWKHFSLFINAENFTDTRQSKFEQMYTGTITQPDFKPIWCNTEGFIFNGGCRIYL